MTNTEVKQKIEELILQLMEQSNLVAWRQPWLFGGLDKAFKGDFYNGINRFVLSFARAFRGNESHVWLTKTKIEGLNGKVWNKKTRRWNTVKNEDGKEHPFCHIKKGAKAVPAVYYNWVTKKDAQGNPVIDDKGNEVKYPLIRTYNVFNGADIEGFDWKEFEPVKVDTGIDIASCEEGEKLILSLYKNHPEVRHGGDRACYIPALDVIMLPDYRYFKSVSEFMSTLVHELAHSTGHKDRLNRAIRNSFGDDAYAFEELVAEFTAAMTLEKLGIHDMSAIENTAAYIKSWAERIRRNPGFLFDAINLARKASAYMLNEAAKESSDEEELVAEAI